MEDWMGWTAEEILVFWYPCHLVMEDGGGRMRYGVFRCSVTLGGLYFSLFYMEFGAWIEFRGMFLLSCLQDVVR